MSHDLDCAGAAGSTMHISVPTHLIDQAVIQAACSCVSFAKSALSGDHEIESVVATALGVVCANCVDGAFHKVAPYEIFKSILPLGR